MSQNGSNLHEWFADAKEEPLSAVFTTFNFEPEYFDLLFLPTVLQMKIDGSIASGAQYAALLQKLATTPVAVIADGRVNLKAAPKVYGYDLQLVMDRTQHAKVFAVEYESSIRLVIGSANLSEAGIHINREIVAALEIGHDSPHWHILRDALSFLTSIADPQMPNLNKALSQMKLKADRLRPSNETLDQSLQFLGIFGRNDQLNFANQATGFLDSHKVKKRDRTIKSLTIVSPYFEAPEPNETPLLSTVVDEIETFNRESLKTERIRPTVSVYVPTTGDMIVTKFPKDAYSKLAQSKKDDVSFYSNPTSQDTKGDRPRFPHGKVYVIGGESFTMVIGGSSNFSPSGFGRLGPRSNIEANLVFFYPSVKRSLTKNLTPQGQTLNLGAASDAAYDFENPDSAHQTPVLLQATFDEGTLTVHASRSAQLDAVNFRIDQTPLKFEWERQVGRTQLASLSHHIIGVYGLDGELIQYFPIFISDGSYNPLKANVTQEELESWIESRYLSAREIPFPGTLDLDAIGPDSLASAAAKDLKDCDTTNYVVYRARDFTRLLTGVAARLAPLKDLSKRLEYHLGEQFGLINLVRKHLDSAKGDHETILGPYCACELITTVVHSIRGQVDTAAIAVAAEFFHNSRLALESFLSASDHPKQVLDYASAVLALLPSSVDSPAPQFRRAE